MTIIYRLCAIPSTNPSPIYQENKDKLNELCLRSAVATFKDITPKMIFICDYCPESYRKMIEDNVPFVHEIHFTNLGINGTAIMQYELAEKEDDDVFLFQECDYLWRPSQGKNFYEAVKNFGLVSPYDHPDFYNRYDIHPMETELQIFNNAHYRKSRRNTMTFGMTKEAFENQKGILKKYGYLDNEVWIEMAAKGNKLWTPIPGMATHMVKDFMSPAIPWDVLMKLYDKP